MRDFPSCFGENGVQVADATCSSGVVSVSSNKSSQNSVSCVYKCKLLYKPCLVTIIWSKNLMGHFLSIEINDSSSHEFICKVDVKFTLFSKRKGSKCLQVNSSKIEVFWDLYLAKFESGPEPLEGYYIGIVCKKEMVLLIGDLSKEALKKTSANASFSNQTLISKRENIFAKRVFATKARFCDNGKIHDLKIECDTSCNDDPSLLVHIDSKTVMKVRHLRWKFRGNCSILVDGFQVEVFWDVHNWLFGSSFGNAVFMFQTSSSMEKLWAGPSGDDSTAFSWKFPESLKESKLSSVGFSLFLYCWKNE